MSQHKKYVPEVLLSSFTIAYMKAAANSIDDEEAEEEHGVEHIAQEAWEVMQADCDTFLEKANPYLQSFDDPKRYSHAGRDFWLTRNDQDSGFWDGNWPVHTGELLDELSKEFGPQFLYLGSDGLIHIEQRC